MSVTKIQQRRRTKEFKTKAAKMVVEQGQPQAAVARNLGVTSGQILR